MGVGGHRKCSEDCEGSGGRQRKGPGGANGGFCGLGVELKREDIGKGRRIAEVHKNGGTGVDSSEEKVGKVHVDGSKVDRTIGGIDGLEVDRVMLEDCGVVFQEDCRIGGLHIDICLTSIVDRRRMNSSSIVQQDPVLTMQSCSFVLCRHIVETIAQTDHSVKDEADCCTCRASQIDAYNHKKVQFEM